MLKIKHAKTEAVPYMVSIIICIILFYLQWEWIVIDKVMKNKLVSDNIKIYYWFVFIFTVSIMNIIAWFACKEFSKAYRIEQNWLKMGKKERASRHTYRLPILGLYFSCIICIILLHYVIWRFYIYRHDIELMGTFKEDIIFLLSYLGQGFVASMISYTIYARRAPKNLVQGKDR